LRVEGSSRVRKRSARQGVHLPVCLSVCTGLGKGGFERVCRCDESSLLMSRCMHPGATHSACQTFMTDGPSITHHTQAWASHIHEKKGRLGHHVAAGLALLKRPRRPVLDGCVCSGSCECRCLE